MLSKEQRKRGGAAAARSPETNLTSETLKFNGRPNIFSAFSAAHNSTYNIKYINT